MSISARPSVARRWASALTAASIVLVGIFGATSPAAADELAPEPPVVEQIVEPTPEPEPAPEPAPEPEPVADPAPVVEAPAEPAVEAPADEAPAETLPEEAPEESRSLNSFAIQAVTPTVTVTPNTDVDTTVSNTFTVEGTGFEGAGAAFGAYVLIGPEGNWAEGTPLSFSGWLTSVYVPLSEFTDGAFTKEITLAASTLSPASTYIVATSAAHGLSATDRTLDTRTPFTTAAIVVPPVVPATPSLTVSKTSGLNPTGESITITANNFDGSAANTRGGGKAGFYFQVGYLDTVWKPSESSTTGIRSNAYSAWVADVANASAPTKWTENVDGTVNATWTVSVTKAALDAVARSGASLAVFTVGAGGAVQAGNEFAVPISFAVPAPASLTVSKTVGLNPAGESITITATNFDGSAANTRGGGKAGFYFQVGYLDTVWKPSESGTSGSRSNAYSAWVADAANSSAPTKWTANPDGTVNATWTVSVTKAALDAVARSGATLAVFTVGAGGVVQAANEFAVPISFAVPALTVSKTSGLNPAGESITITATSFDGSAANTRGGGKAGFYFQVGYLDTVWKPSETSSTGIRSNAYSAWVADAANASAPTKWTANPDGTVNATWTVSITKAALDAVARSGATLAVFTVGAGGVVQATNEFAVPISFTGASTPTTPTNPTNPTNPTGASVSLSVTPNSVDRTVSNTFTISGTGYTGDGAANGAYVSIGAASVWQPGQVPSTGGWLQTVHVAPSSIVSGSFSTVITIPANTFVAGQTYGAATFAAHGLSITNRTLDAWAPISLGGASTTTAGVNAGKIPETTPPATTGAKAESNTEPKEGEEFTVTADGFQPGEKGVLVVIYSTPTLLGTVDADATGAVSWTGKLPRGLTGEHTFTFQGSVNRGLVIDIAAADVIGCPVDDATLDWGFKESFRSYISGSIANGEWTVADGATYETPSFGWAEGTGGYDTQTAKGDIGYAGSITFTGHGGVLNTTVANPRLVFDGVETASLLLDISGTTQEGAPINSLGVEFATLDVSGAVAKEGKFTVTDASAVLTADGAAAFGTYPEGEELDPVSFAFTLDPDCSEAVAIGDNELDSDNTSASSSLWWLWIVGAVVLLAVIAAIILIVRRRQGA